MGLKIHSLAEIPDSISRSYYLYVMDYYNWDELIYNTLKENFDRMADFASKNDSIIIHPIGESHFFSELLSWECINGMKPEEILPAIMITTLHPTYFLDRHNKNTDNEATPKNEIIFIKIKELCKSPSDVVKIIEKLFSDIQSKKEIKDFIVAKEIRAGKNNTLVDSLILEPNIAGVGIDIKKLLSFFKKLY